MKKTEFIEQIRIAIRRSHYSWATEKTYCGVASRFWDFSLAHLDKSRAERARLFLDAPAPNIIPLPQFTPASDAHRRTA